MKRFKKIYIEITNICNLNCEFCPSSERKNAFMSLAQIETVFSKIKPFTDYVYLHVKGEPLLHPEIDKILDLANQFEIKVNITTTGTLINSTKNKLLNKPALRQLNFSLHSYNASLAVFNKNNYFETIFNFTDELLSVSQTIISFRLWNLESIYEPEKQRAKNRIILSEIEKKYRLEPIEEKHILGKGIKIKDRLFLNFEPQFEWPNLNSNFENTVGFCHGLRTHLGILVDGTVIPCCLDGEGVINLGNIFTEDFNSIINSPRANSIYNGFSENRAVETLCKKCSYKGKFE